ncbi:MAG: molecular chaperone TorD family protein [Nitrospirae bacterium YQR-1]
MLAWLVNEPDKEIVDFINDGTLYNTIYGYFLANSINSGNIAQLKDENITFDSLCMKYYGSFNDRGVSLVESVYKPWSTEPGSGNSSKGFLMGDSALHMSFLYESFGIEIPEAYACMPDHLALELDFLSFLYDNYPSTHAQLFMSEHLNWIPSLIDEAVKNKMDEFYLSVLRITDDFICFEKNAANEVFA